MGDKMVMWALHHPIQAIAIVVVIDILISFFIAYCVMTG
jgi:hypothetical protein